MKKFLLATLFTLLGSASTLAAAHFYLTDLLYPATIFDIRTAKKSCEDFASKLGYGTCIVAGAVFLQFETPSVRESKPEGAI